MMRFTIVAGARPNFMKIAPIISELKQAKNRGEDVNYRLVHTGQHYDEAMSEKFFKQLGIPQPDVNLGCHGGTQAEQVASVMVAFESELSSNPADWVVVVGDVNSTMACAITSKKLKTKVAHVEAGIRSGDITMPEEINRIVTDSISDLYFTTSKYANENLLRLGVEPDSIKFVGNVMIDTLVKNLESIQKPDFYNQIGLRAKNYYVLTLHRPSNVDDVKSLKSKLSCIIDAAAGIPLVFPVHPRTANALSGVSLESSGIFYVPPQGYHEFIYLVKNSLGVITDSGGISEEATFLDVPCITLRNSTERPETVVQGTNVLIGEDVSALPDYMIKMKNGNWKTAVIPELWDGRSSERIVRFLLDTGAAQ